MTPNNPSPSSNPEDAHWGLAGFGKAGAWEVSLDHRPSPAEWNLAIEGPNVYFNIVIENPATARRFGRVLSSRICCAYDV